MNDYKMNHAKKHKDTQVDYITVIDHSTLKKEIKTLLEIKVDDKVTLDDVIRKLDETINNLTNNIFEITNRTDGYKEQMNKLITELQDKNKALEDKVNALEELFKEKTKNYETRGAIMKRVISKMANVGLWVSGLSTVALTSYAMYPEVFNYGLDFFRHRAIYVRWYCRTYRSYNILRCYFKTT